MRFRKVYFAPLPFSLGHNGCIYDSKNMKFNCHMNNLFNFNMSLTHLKYHLPITRKGIYNNSVKLLLALSIDSKRKTSFIYERSFEKDSEHFVSDIALKFDYSSSETVSSQQINLRAIFW